MTNHQLYKLTIALLPLFLSFNVIAQTPRRACATTELMQEQIRQNPELTDKIEEIEQHTLRFVAQSQLNTRSSVIAVPVVVHIVYRNANSIENISDEQILSQLEVLNKDYRHLNDDRTSTPSVFQPLASDTELEFKLAKRTPNGKATTGIMRYPSSRLTPWGKNDEVKMADKGGVTPWDATKYLNIYVCAIGSGVLGYSTMPGTPTQYDGVVIDYRYFGTKGTVVSPFDKGRTATHEIGHWLNLRHIWGDKTCGDDSVSDTPVQESPNYGCVSYPHKTCGNQSSGDMFVNFMDYTDDACMNMFTKGQKTRMQAIFANGGIRNSLIYSDALIVPNENCPAPINLSISSIATISATVKWTGVDGITDYTMEYRAKGTVDWLLLNAKNATSVTISNLTSNKTYECRIKSVCTSPASEYSSLLAFTTLPTSTDCTDIYESNNTFATAKAIPINTTISALINNSTDNDYLIIKNDDQRRDIKISLFNLPYDYDVRLYNANHQLVGSSTKAGKTDEKIIFNNAPVGTYYVRVYPNSGSSATECYKLTVEISSLDFLRGNESGTDNQMVSVDKLKVFPNPATEFLIIELETEYEGDATIQILDMTSREVLRLDKNISKDINTFQMDVNNIRDGIYMVLIRYGNKTQCKKVIINNLL